MRKMKMSTLTRIARNAMKDEYTYIGQYAYDIQYHPMMSRDCVIRCRRDLIGEEHLVHGYMCSYWEWCEPVDWKAIEKEIGRRISNVV